MTWVNPDRLDDRMDAKPFQVAILSRLDATDSCGFPVVRLGSPRAREYLNRGVGGAVEQPTAVRLFKTRHVRSGYLEMETAFLPESKIPQLGPKLLKKGDVLLTSTGLGTIGRAALFMGEEKATVDNHVTIIRTTAHINSGYLSALLNSTYGSAWTDWGTTGSTGQLELTREKVSEIRLPCPDRRIQDYIGAKVELAERCRAEAATIEKYCLELFAEGLGEEPDSWLSQDDSNGIFNAGGFAISISPDLIRGRLDPVGYHPELLFILIITDLGEAVDSICGIDPDSGQKFGSPHQSTGADLVDKQ